MKFNSQHILKRIAMLVGETQPAKTGMEACNA
jgi:hypothetical protein